MYAFLQRFNPYVLALAMYGLGLQPAFSNFSPEENGYSSTRSALRLPSEAAIQLQETLKHQADAPWLEAATTTYLENLEELIQEEPKIPPVEAKVQTSLSSGDDPLDAFLSAVSRIIQDSGTDAWGKTGASRIAAFVKAQITEPSRKLLEETLPQFFQSGFDLKAYIIHHRTLVDTALTTLGKKFASSEDGDLQEAFLLHQNSVEKSLEAYSYQEALKLFTYADLWIKSDRQFNSKRLPEEVYDARISSVRSAATLLGKLLPEAKGEVENAQTQLRQETFSALLGELRGQNEAFLQQIGTSQPAAPDRTSTISALSGQVRAITSTFEALSQNSGIGHDSLELNKKAAIAHVLSGALALILEKTLVPEVRSPGKRVKEVITLVGDLQARLEEGARSVTHPLLEELQKLYISDIVTKWLKACDDEKIVESTSAEAVRESGAAASLYTNRLDALKAAQAQLLESLPPQNVDGLKDLIERLGVSFRVRIYHAFIDEVANRAGLIASDMIHINAPEELQQRTLHQYFATNVSKISGARHVTGLELSQIATHALVQALGLKLPNKPMDFSSPQYLKMLLSPQTLTYPGFIQTFARELIAGLLDLIVTLEESGEMVKRESDRAHVLKQYKTLQADIKNLKTERTREGMTSALPRMLGKRDHLSHRKVEQLTGEKITRIEAEVAVLRKLAEKQREIQRFEPLDSNFVRLFDVEEAHETMGEALAPFLGEIIRTALSARSEEEHARLYEPVIDLAIAYQSLDDKAPDYNERKKELNQRKRQLYKTCPESKHLLRLFLNPQCYLEELNSLELQKFRGTLSVVQQEQLTELRGGLEILDAEELTPWAYPFSGLLSDIVSLQVGEPTAHEWSLQPTQLEGAKRSPGTLLLNELRKVGSWMGASQSFQAAYESYEKVRDSVPVQTVVKSWPVHNLLCGSSTIAGEARTLLTSPTLWWTGGAVAALFVISRHDPFPFPAAEALTADLGGSCSPLNTFFPCQYCNEDNSTCCFNNFNVQGVALPGNGTFSASTERPGYDSNGLPVGGILTFPAQWQSCNFWETPMQQSPSTQKVWANCTNLQDLNTLPCTPGDPSASIFYWTPTSDFDQIGTILREVKDNAGDSVSGALQWDLLDRDDPPVMLGNWTMAVPVESVQVDPQTGKNFAQFILSSSPVTVTDLDSNQQGEQYFGIHVLNISNTRFLRGEGTLPLGTIIPLTDIIQQKIGMFIAGAPEGYQFTFEVCNIDPGTLQVNGPCTAQSTYSSFLPKIAGINDINIVIPKSIGPTTWEQVRTPLLGVAGSVFSFMVARLAYKIYKKHRYAIDRFPFEQGIISKLGLQILDMKKPHAKNFVRLIKQVRETLHDDYGIDIEYWSRPGSGLYDDMRQLSAAVATALYRRTQANDALHSKYFTPFILMARKKRIKFEEMGENHTSLTKIFGQEGVALAHAAIALIAEGGDEDFSLHRAKGLKTPFAWCCKGCTSHIQAKLTWEDIRQNVKLSGGVDPGPWEQRREHGNLGRYLNHLNETVERIELDDLKKEMEEKV